MGGCIRVVLGVLIVLAGLALGHWITPVLYLVCAGGLILIAGDRPRRRSTTIMDWWGPGGGP